MNNNQVSLHELEDLTSFFWKMEDDPNFRANGRRPQFFVQMEEDLNFYSNLEDDLNFLTNLEDDINFNVNGR